LRRGHTAQALLALIAAGWFCSSIRCEAETQDGRLNEVCEAEMLRASRIHQVPPAVLYAVGLTETGRRGRLSPYALNIDGKPVFSATLGEALLRFAQSNRAGAKLIDVGCMQINYRFHGREFSSIEDMFEPARNVDYAARYLKQLRRRETSWTLAVARYHAGPHNNPAQQKYVCNVISNMIAAGIGNWTKSAELFCLKPDTNGVAGK
jgi:soluble lytic murein transglycosylase-like protein